MSLMSLARVLPEIQSLPRTEKIQLLRLLAQELAEEEAMPTLEAGQSYPIWSPDQAFAGAATLLKLLDSE